MKIFIILALVTLAAADWKPKSREDLQKARQECLKNLDMPQELKEKLKRLEYPDNELVKQFILCGARGAEILDESKGLMADRIMLLLEGETSMSKEEVRAIIDGCLDNNSQGSSLQDWVFRNYKCVIESELRDSFKKIMKKID